MDISIWQIVIILVAGVAGGFINTLAGAGSFIMLAALEMAGLSGSMANGTSRVAIQAQNIMAVLGFRSKGLSNFRMSLQFAIPALIGAVLGAYIIIELPEVVFHRVLGAAMVLMLVVLAVNPNKWFKGHRVEFTPRRRIVGYLIFFALGVYGGAIQAAVGILLMAGLVLFAGMNLVETNMHKVFIVGIYTIFALATFALRGEVNWLLGLVLAVGNGLGGWIGSRMAVENGENMVRGVLAVTLAVLALRYLGIVQFF